MDGSPRKGSSGRAKARAGDPPEQPHVVSNESPIHIKHRTPQAPGRKHTTTLVTTCQNPEGEHRPRV